MEKTLGDTTTTAPALFQNFSAVNVDQKMMIKMNPDEGLKTVGFDGGAPGKDSRKSIKNIVIGKEQDLNL